MRRTIIAGISAVALLSAGTATALLGREKGAPPPTEEQLRTRGFAVWPEDTVAEAAESCEDPDSWQLDAERTALRFAQEVFDFPDTRLQADPISDESDSTHRRYHINAKGQDLGSIIRVSQYDECWFVDNAEPREGWWLPSIGFVHYESTTKLLVSTQGVETEIGYGPLDEHIDGNPAQAVVDISDLSPDATGHVVAAGTADTLGYVPAPATKAVTGMTLKEIVAQPDICNGEDSSNHPHFALSELIGFGLDRQTGGVSSRELELRGRDTIERIDDDTWALTIQGTPLTAKVPKIKRGCWRALAMKSRSPRQSLRALLISEESATFRLNWGRATSASVTLSGDRGGNSWTFARFDAPITVRTHEGWSPLDGPFEVTIVLRQGKRIIAAERTWQQSS